MFEDNVILINFSTLRLS